MDLSSLIGYLPDSAMGYVNLGTGVVAASALFMASISKLTANKTDDKIASFLGKVHDCLGWFVPGSVKMSQRPVRVVDRRGA